MYGGMGGSGSGLVSGGLMLDAPKMTNSQFVDGGWRE